MSHTKALSHVWKRIWLPTATCASAALGAVSSGQAIAPRESASPWIDSDVGVALVLEGFVVGPEGNPAESAVVVSSAGGRALTDAAGSYRLEVEVPPDATSVQVTAVGSAGGDLVASSSVLICGARVARVDPLQLVLGNACSPAWLPTFGGEPGTNDFIQVLAVYDDGSGPALYAGGHFTTAGGMPASSIAKWDGSSWSALGSGVAYSNDPRSTYVHALAVYDDGGGPALYVGGFFTIAGGVPANHIARWDGSSWSTLGSGMDWGVGSLEVHDDGTGPALYVGGEFVTAGGVPANHIAKWDGSSWTALGSGVDSYIWDLAVHDDGSGLALYAGGSFRTAGGLLVDGIAKWDGLSWSGLGTGVYGWVATLAVYDDGGGPALYIGGNFATVDGIPANDFAKWDGATWSALNAGFGEHDTVYDLIVHDDGSGAALYAAAASTIAKWNGSSLSALDRGVNSFAYALAVYDDGGGSALYAGGYFTAAVAGDVPAMRIAKWDGSSWSALGRGMNPHVRALVGHDDGGGPALYAGGSFTTAGGRRTNRIAKWDGASWFALGAGRQETVQALAVYDDGGGPALYAGGAFLTAGGATGDRIAKWDGSSWSALGRGIFGSVSALAVHDDGGGQALYAGGRFTTAGGVRANHIARWDGSSWSALGSGMNDSVLALTVFDDGSGPALYAGGFFTIAGGVPANRIAKWDGIGWSGLGSGIAHADYPGNGYVDALAVYDDGRGPALYAGGLFTTAGGLPANYIARWDGTGWSALGSGSGALHFVSALAAHDDGRGPALYAGGSFKTASGLAANFIARWDGTSWSSLGSGMNGFVFALTVHNDGRGPALFAGGDFSSALDSGDSYIAMWGRRELDLDFSAEDDFSTALRNGQDISNPPEFGRLVSISSSGENARAAVFDSTPGGPNDPGPDRDLLVGSGNILILQSDEEDEDTGQTVPGYFDRPNDDEDGGTMTFRFPAPVAPMSLDLIDIDSGKDELCRVLLTDDLALTRIFTVPPLWTGDRLKDGTSGKRTLDLTTLAPQPGFQSTATATESAGFDPGAVVRIEVRLNSGGAVDSLAWCPARSAGRGRHESTSQSGAPAGPMRVR